MISIYQIKPAFQRLLRPLLKVLFKLGVLPNHLTLLAMFSSILIGIGFYVEPNGIMRLILPLFLLFRMALNALDGMMATTYELKSRAGEILNEVGDVISDAALYIPLIALTETSALVVIVFVWLAALNELAGILAKVISGERRYDGPMGKSDRALVIGLTLFIGYFWGGITLYLNIILSAAILLMVLSTYLRLKRCLKTGT